MNSFTAMDQVGKYWGIWGASTRRSSSTAAAASPFPAAAWATQAGGRSEPSWEERAFARDAAEHLGGCVWPPRSYSCTFCHREFRSAQALGGHMNVHRRDRALLRQGGSSPEDQPQQSGALLCRAAAAAAASNPNTTTATSAADKGVTTTPPSFLSTIIKESKNKLIMSSSMDQYGDFDVIGNDDGEESARGIKRRRLDHPSAATAALLIFVQPMAAEVKSCESSQGLLQGLPLDHHDANNKVPQSSTCPNTSSSPDQQEVDLELRLGTTPKVT